MLLKVGASPKNQLLYKYCYNITQAGIQYRIKALRQMKKISTTAKAITAFVASHIVCCAPLFAPAIFGAAISGVALGGISLMAIAGVYAGSYALYKRNQQKQNDGCGSGACKKPYVRSTSFTQASIISASVALGAAFNHTVIHPLMHKDHHEHEQSFEDIINDPQNMCRSSTNTL